MDFTPEALAQELQKYQDGQVLYFQKPLTWTSFKLVNEVRFTLCRSLKNKKLKVGHAGTLDPLATGVMIVCTGRATKRIESLQGQTKEYVATLELGATTPSFDLEKPIDATFDFSHVTRELAAEVVSHFIGTIEQVPPTYSACKIQGRRAYEMAREGEQVELRPKTLVIDEIEMLDFQMPDENAGLVRPRMKLRIVCSKGTYIRALARDIGQALQCGAHLTALQRTRVGEVRLEDCLDIYEFKKEYLPDWVETDRGPLSFSGRKKRVIEKNTEQTDKGL